MSFSDVLGFEAFNLKDMWEKVKDEPLALLLGGMEPAGAALWQGLGVLDDNFEPPVNVLGGPFGGGTLGLDNTGGVYLRANEAGMDTGAPSALHDLAEMIAASYAGGYGFDQLGNFLNVDGSQLQMGANLLGQENPFGNLPVAPSGNGASETERRHAEELMRQAMLMQEARRRGL